MANKQVELQIGDRVRSLVGGKWAILGHHPSPAYPEEGDLGTALKKIGPDFWRIEIDGKPNPCQPEPSGWCFWTHELEPATAANDWDDYLELL